MAKKKKQKHRFGKKEFIFNLISLVTIVCIGIYFGGRCLYYYSKQNRVTKTGDVILSEAIINNSKLVDKGDGFHRDSDGYYFKGKVANNYVSFGNRIFRIIRINNDNTIRMVSENNVASFMWGTSSEYQTSNVRNWLEKTQEDYSGVYYDTIPAIDKFLVKTSYQEDILENDKVTSAKDEYNDYITTLGIKDYIYSGGKDSFINNGKLFFILGTNTEQNNLYVEEDGSIQECDSLDAYGIKSVITLKANIKMSSGDGTANNPYIIYQGKDTNYVDSYVKLGNDIWKVYNEKDGILRLYTKDYAMYNGKEILYRFSYETNVFDLEDETNIAKNLNGPYYNSLSYRNLLVDVDYYNGEVSQDTDFSYKSIYSNKVKCKVALLSIFDYNSTNHDAYYHIDTIPGDMQYITYKNGIVEEVEIDTMRHLVPTIAIKSSSIKSGKGTLDKPYLVG